MSELIERSAVIDAMKDMYRAAEKWGRDATDDATKARAESCMASLVEIKLRTEKLPAVQPEIIRCKDCKYCDRGIDEDGNSFLKCLGWVYGGTQEEDFCSHAERRTE